jgi:kumamolisin
VQDLDIVHALAPAAKLIVYNTPGPADIVPSLIRVNDKMVSDHLGNVVSESMGWCADAAGAPSTATSSGLQAFDKSSADQLDAVMTRGRAEGMSFLVSSGDEGGFGCVRLDGDQHRVSTDLPASDPNVTSVGGTTVFLSANGTYFKETAWGNALSWNASGGGNSSFFARPSWQTGPGVVTSASTGMRQVPDVAGLADENTGWDIALNGTFCGCGSGTSASAPLWAGFIALLNQDLARKGMRPVGFANPAIYDIGRRNDQLAGPPFHSVTEGTNLVYPTSPGWNYATGWGSMNAGALASAWEDYIQSGGV